MGGVAALSYHVIRCLFEVITRASPGPRGCVTKCSVGRALGRGCFPLVRAWLRSLARVLQS